MNWYKKSYNMADALAFTVAQMIIEAYNGVNYGDLGKAQQVVSTIPDESSLNAAMAKGLSMAAKALNLDLTQQDNAVLSVFSTIQSAFFAKIQEQEQANHFQNEFIRNTDEAVDQTEMQPQTEIA